MKRYIPILVTGGCILWIGLGFEIPLVKYAGLAIIGVTLLIAGFRYSRDRWFQKE